MLQKKKKKPRNGKTKTKLLLLQFLRKEKLFNYLYPSHLLLLLYSQSPFIS